MAGAAIFEEIRDLLQMQVHQGQERQEHKKRMEARVEEIWEALDVLTKGQARNQLAVDRRLQTLVGLGQETRDGVLDLVEIGEEVSTYKAPEGKEEEEGEEEMEDVDEEEIKELIEEMDEEKEVASWVQEGEEEESQTLE